MGYMGQIKYGIIHAHTDNSVKDSVLSPTKLIKRAAELGAPAVVLSDHGVLTGVYEFMNAAKTVGIKGIPGIEAYLQEDDDTAWNRSHLLLIPTDYQGYQAISQAVTKSNTRLFKGTPCMCIAILKECFGPGSSGHGHVIATSACVSGVLAKVLLSDRNMERDREKFQEKLSGYNNPNAPEYLKLCGALTDIGDEITVLMKERDRLAKIAGRKFAAKEKSLLSLAGESLRIAQLQLNEEKMETEKAARLLSDTKSLIAAKRVNEISTRRQCAALAKTHTKWNHTNAQIDRINDNLKGEAELFKEMKRLALTLDGIFERGSFYVELQNHGIPEETYVMPRLAKAAEQLGIPTVACNDVHFAMDTPECVRARQIVQSLRFNKWHKPQPGDTEYYIKDDAQLSQSLSAILSEDTVEKAMKGIGEIIARCDVAFPKGNHLPVFKSGSGESAKQRLHRLANEGIAWRYPAIGSFTKAHRDRMNYELDVIERLEYCDYLCIVQDFLAYGRKLGLNNPEGVGLGVGPGRGSAVGSLVCYLTGITSIDPLKYGLIFERFLNADRVSMPDIDSDFGMQIRGMVIDYVKKIYGEKAVCCILAKGTLAAKAAVRNVARVLGDELYGDTQALYQKGDAIANAIPKTPGIQLDEVLDQLRETFAGDKDALKIIEDARLVEGANFNHSMHAAGVIISDNEDISNYVPLMFNTDQGQWMSQCDKVETEKSAGLMKMDFLGLRTLNIITDTLRAIYRNHGVRIDIESAPFEQEVFESIFSSGRTNGVFQFESQGMKKMLTRFKPGSIEDIILLVAAYRPGPLQYLDKIISVKHGRTKPRYIVPAMEDILSETYGYPVYQEQIMMVAHKIAGFTMGEADIIRAAISKKKLDELVKDKDKYINGLIVAGATESAANRFWDELLDFGRYAFNKSHACAYAHLAYYTAWLKHHYPTEFMVSTLNYTPTDKLPMMLRDCRAFGQTILPPDVNASEFNFTGANNRIRMGLSNIKNVKEAANTLLAERKKGRFESFPSLLTRVSMKVNEIESMITGGAMDGWGYSRSALLYTLPFYLDDLKVIMKKRQIIRELTAANSSNLSEKERKSLKTRLNNAGKKLEEYEYRFNKTEIPADMMDDRLQKLSREHELLGMYVSGNPLESYPQAKKLRTRAVTDAAADETVTLCGIISDVTVKGRKSDGALMAFFTLSDETGDIGVSCFTKAYSRFESIITNNVAVAIAGRCYNDTTYDDEEAEIKLAAEKISLLPHDKSTLVITIADMRDWIENIYPALRYFEAEDGSPICLFDQSANRFRDTGLRMAEDVLNQNSSGLDIQKEE